VKEFLTIDCGAKHRKIKSFGKSAFYQWLKRTTTLKVIEFFV
jgi:hypothetical protein